MEKELKKEKVVQPEPVKHDADGKVIPNIPAQPEGTKGSREGELSK